MGGNRRKILVTSGLVLAMLALLAIPTLAECPNGCSGNGACMAKDMCNCYKNYQGNDCLDRTCQFDYAHADTPKGDINMDQTRLTSGWILLNSQQAPQKTYEYFNPTAGQDEAHFYMECSNKGLCDRSLGTCTCFDGFEGVACQRATCPNQCSGHGKCENTLQFGNKAPGTLFGYPTSTTAITYDLWDKRVTYGCRCDPWYTGADCSLRLCKVGVDPMFLSAGSATYKTFALHVYTTGAFTADVAGAAPQNFVRLRMFDYHGESYISNVIPIVDDSGSSANANTNAASVATALLSIPNQTFRNVLCEAFSLTSGQLDGYLSTRPTSEGLSVVCQLYNPGRLRTPQVASYGFKGITDPTTENAVVYTMDDGTDNEWFTTDSGITYSTIDNGVSGTFSIVTVTSPSGTVAETNPTLFKFGSHVFVGMLTSTTSITLSYPTMHTLSSSNNRFNVASGSGLVVTELVVATAVAVGATAITVSASVTIATGQLIFFENQFYIPQNTGVAVTSITLDRPFPGNTLNGGDNTVLKVYVVTPPANSYKYNYVSQCSGRGLCTTDSGVCACFKGYTNDNCDTQNILAL